MARGRFASSVLNSLVEYNTEGEEEVQASIESNSGSTISTPEPSVMPSTPVTVDSSLINVAADRSETPPTNKRAASEAYNPRTKRPSRGSRLLVEAVTRSTHNLINAFDRAREGMKGKSQLQIAVDIVHDEMEAKSADFRVKLLLKLMEGSNAEVFNCMTKDERAVYAAVLETP